MHLRAGFPSDSNDNEIKYKCDSSHVGLTFQIFFPGPDKRKMLMAEPFSAEPAKRSQIAVCKKEWPVYEEAIHYLGIFSRSFEIILHVVLCLVSEIFRAF